MTQNTNYRRFEAGNGNPAAMALEDYHDKLHEIAERHRLDGVKPTKAQRKKAFMHSCMVIRDITESMLPKAIG
jgi:hypothetical protein